MTKLLHAWRFQAHGLKEWLPVSALVSSRGSTASPRLQRARCSLLGEAKGPAPAEGAGLEHPRSGSPALPAPCPSCRSSAGAGWAPIELTGHAPPRGELALYMQIKDHKQLSQGSTRAQADPPARRAGAWRCPADGRCARAPPLATHSWGAGAAAVMGSGHPLPLQ